MKPLSSLLLLLFLVCTAARIFTTSHTLAATPQAKNSYDSLVPQCLLGLLHAPEVHKDLNLSSEQVNKLEVLLRKVDARWFPARILPTEEQRPVIRELETEAWNWFGSNATATQRQRLQQLECHAQNNRMLLREDVAQRIGLKSSQQQKLADLARATDESKLVLARTLYGDPQIKKLQQKADQAARAEREGLSKIVQTDQWEKLKALLGDPFDATRLKRIYPLAPEFVPVRNWINSSPLTMKELRGKVVLVHFYAFQCHNCHANFGIYRRWHKELTDKGVVVVGIQTPETKTERDITAVTAAAAERDLKFPILFDLDAANWNAWGNTVWPCVYVIDKQGYLRMWWQGELNWKGATGDKSIEEAVNKLLAEK
ncbi:MAG: redoxin domain-containing protein [Planctomycetales bacterium]